MRADLFDYALPPELIPQAARCPREEARLLLIGPALRTATIADLPELLAPGDLLVVNDTRVLPTRFWGRRGDVPVEVTLVEQVGGRQWWALARPGRRLRPGDTILLAEDLEAEVLRKDGGGRALLAFDAEGEALRDLLRARGAMPLPPYIRRVRGGDPADRDAYQSVFAARDGAVAAPTASLHMTPSLLARLDARGIDRVAVTLHVGSGTFAPVKVDDARDHVMHAERYEVGAGAVEAIRETQARGGRVVALGTTVLRALEAAAAGGEIRPVSGSTALFVTPGFRFRLVDLLITNFHLPRSTLLMLVCAFAGTDRVLAAYAYAVEERFRFFSYGDACLVERAG